MRNETFKHQIRKTNKQMSKNTRPESSRTHTQGSVEQRELRQKPKAQTFNKITEKNHKPRPKVMQTESNQSRIKNRCAQRKTSLQYTNTEDVKNTSKETRLVIKNMELHLRQDMGPWGV